MSSDNPQKAAVPLRVGIAGLGVVGGEVARQLSHQADHLAGVAGRPFQITVVSARSRVKDRGFAMAGIDWVDNAAEIAERDDVDIVVEMIGGEEGVALDLVTRALETGKHVITANKAMLAHHGTRLARLAEENDVALMYEAAIAGGIPAVKSLREGLAGNRVSRVSGILNGTCNYILTRMEKTGEPFDAVLADAQTLGYAEAEPSLDVDGIDAAHKLTILAAIAFGQTPQFDR
ncbi:MAG: homoserine dehydrogenase, partial [Pseudomonadota bacterium]|nr:homoserine dehydrogenase [Pseudomonadota bacterium]